MADKPVEQLSNEEVKSESDAKLRERVRELELELDGQRRRSAKEALVRSVEGELTKAGAVDVEAVAQLAMASLEGENADTRQVQRVVRELRERRPRLFEGAPREGSMGPMRGGSSEADDAAQRALETGHRRALLEYLRLRRK
jgi:hypothetical protein